MRGTLVVQWLIILAVAAALGYLVVQVAKGWAGWIVFGVIVLAALGGAIAAWNREYPYRTTKRRFTRDSESDW